MNFSVYENFSLSNHKSRCNNNTLNDAQDKDHARFVVRKWSSSNDNPINEDIFEY